MRTAGSRSIELSIAIVAALAGSAAAEAPLSGNVLVWADAPLYLDAAASGASVRVGTLDLGREKDVGHVVPMHVVSVHDDVVEVEPTADTECAWWRMVKPEGLDNVRLFVKRADLAPVLTKAFKASYKDGSSVSLQAGVAVLDGTVGFNRGVVPVKIPAASVGVSYKPHKVAAVPKLSKKFLLDEATDVMLDGATFPLGPWVAGAAQPKGKRMMVTIAARCMTAVISAPKEHVHAGVAINQALAAAPPPRRVATSTGSERHYLPAGTKLTSETGDHVVATLTSDRDVLKPKPAGRACAEFVITRDDPFVDVPHTADASQPQRTLELCAPGELVKTERR
jgi:hypothetical protein